jgi:N-acetylmuramic acid 6-phosphate etherase
MTTPADRSHIDTEQRNPRSADLHRLGVAELVERIQAEDASLPQAMAAAAPALTAFIADAEPGFLRGGRLLYLGAGTSGRLGVLDASEAPPTFQVSPERIQAIIAGGDGALRRSSEGKEDNADGAIDELRAFAPGPDDSILGIAAGGTTPYVRGALVWCRQLHRPPVCGLLTCASVPTPAAGVHLIHLPTGPELLTGSTRMKAGTATKLALNCISTALMVRSGRVYGNLMVDVRASNAKLQDRAARIVSALVGCDRDSAFALLKAAGDSAKTAIVMGSQGCDRISAEALLTQAGGRLDHLLDERGANQT